MQEIKIPEGCKASIDFEKRVVVIESEKPKFKRGDVIIYCTGNFAIIGSLFNEDEHQAIVYAEKKHDRYSIEFTTKRFISPNNPRLATPSEQQLLFDALAKEGKRWNAETLQIEDIEKDILVPDKIQIYKLDKDIFTDCENGDRLFIAVNDKQLLGFRDSFFVVDTKYGEWYNQVKCKLVACKRKDLKAGDTAFSSHFESNISKTINLGDYCKIIDNNSIAHASFGSIYKRGWQNSQLKWYKVVPINN